MDEDALEQVLNLSKSASSSHKREVWMGEFLGLPCHLKTRVNFY
jgi:hypothetical protein